MAIEVTERAERENGISEIVSPLSVPVVVVGAGPVGLSLAIELRLHGIEVLVIERDISILDGHPKGRSTDMRTLEYYRRWGVADELRKLGWQARDPVQRLIITETLLDRPLGAFPLGYGRHVDESRDLAAEPSMSVPQPITMRVLQRRALGLGAQILRGWEATDFNQDDEKVTTQLRSPSGTMYRVVSSYVVGCDGPNSLVRKAAGITRIGADAIAKANSYVVQSEGHRIADLLSSPGHSGLGMLMVLNPGACSIISIPDDEHWGFSILGSLDEEPTADEIERRGQLLLGAEVPIRVVSQSSFKVFTRVAQSYRTGRFFIAGDAAHICPPTGGHNMNVGIGDAVNLGWKLAAVLKGLGGEALLESYDLERRPVGNRVADSAMQNSYSMGEAADAFRGMPLLGEEDGEPQRFQRGEVAYKLTYPQWNTHGIVLDQRYGESPVSIPDGSEAPAWSGTEYWQYARPGHLAPHLWLPDGTPLYDHFGDFFTLLDIDASEEQVARLVAAAGQVGLPLTRLRLPSNVAQGRYPASIALIRPDQYIAWQGNHCDDPVSIINKIRGR